jgi:hypothetical protein
MLWAETNSDHPGGNPAQHGKFFKQARGQRWSRLLSCIEDALKEMLMHKDLHPLRKVGGPLAALLNSAQIVQAHTAFAQGMPQNICCRDGILDREVDANAVAPGSIRTLSEIQPSH